MATNLKCLDPTRAPKVGWESSVHGWIGVLVEACSLGPNLNHNRERTPVLGACGSTFWTPQLPLSDPGAEQ